MAIARALPVPSDDLQAIRGRLSERYGADVWEGDGRRVLIIRVPRDEPDPVNDVEEAIEYLQPDLVQDITHCLLVGRIAAQVYVRPLQDLMRERVTFDARVAETMRSQLPQGLSHMTFQSPEDPRRRWRLAVRIPVARLADMAEHHLEDLSDGIGPQLDTPRFKQLIAVYLITQHDHVRLEPEIFLPEIRQKWEDEERRRRAHIEIATKAEEDQRRRERERQRLVEELESRLERAGVPKSGRASGRGHEDEPRGTPLFEAESTFITPSGPWTAAEDQAAADAARHAAEALASETRAGSTPEGVPRDRPSAPLDIEGDVERHVERRNDINHRLESLRARVDQAIGVAPSTPKTRSGRIRRPVDPDFLERSKKPDEAETSSPDAPGGAESTEASSSDPGKEVDPAPDARKDPKGALRHRLVDAGFEVLESPEIPGHVIDIAAERPSGDPQRIVARFAECLDIDTAKELLKTARELEVDMVLCITEHPEPEGQRLLVATKVKAMRPGDVGRLAV